MNRVEHLLGKVAEEAVEVAQRALKAQAFGLDEVQAGQLLTNRERLLLELQDLYAVIEMTGLQQVYRDNIDRKKAKVEKFMGYCRRLGTLTE